jgi:hypothetical protein
MGSRNSVETANKMPAERLSGDVSNPKKMLSRGEKNSLNQVASGQHLDPIINSDNLLVNI